MACITETRTSRLNCEDDFEVDKMLDRMESIAAKYHPNEIDNDEEDDKDSETISEQAILEEMKNLIEGLRTIFEQERALANSANNDKISPAKSKRTSANMKYLSSKDTKMKPRPRSHSSVGVDEIVRHESVDSNSRKSRRVSLGMRPKLTSWSKMKATFKRDKPSSVQYPSDKVDSYSCCSADELYTRNTSEPIAYSSDEYFDYEQEASEGDVDELSLDSPDRNVYYSRDSPTQPQLPLLHFKKSADSTESQNGMKKTFRWYRAKSITPSLTLSNDQQFAIQPVSSPSSPVKTECPRFLYDSDTIDRFQNSFDDSTADDIRKSETQQLNLSGSLREMSDNYNCTFQKRLSREFNDKYHEWKKKIGANSNRDFTIENIKRTMESPATRNLSEPKLSVYLGEQNFSPSFRQRFEEWQTMKDNGNAGEKSPFPKNKSGKCEGFLKKHKTEWNRWRSGSKSESNVLKFFSESKESELPDGAECIPPHPKNRSEKKELAWLDKELQKVACEKHRLEKEKEKYVQRESRLRNMKRAIKTGKKSEKEIIVPTSVGLFKFQGISSKFTRKLYQWEKSHGITDESSTFKLLDNATGIRRMKRATNSDSLRASMARSRSVGSVDVPSGVELDTASTHQHSSLSLNDMEQFQKNHLRDSNDNFANSDMSFLNQNETEVGEDAYNNFMDYKLDPYNKDLSESTSFLRENELSESRNTRDVHNSRISSKDFEQRKSANLEAVNIVNQIKRLRASTSTDDQDRMASLSNLQNLADQLLNMVTEMNSRKSESVDDLVGTIMNLAVELKNEIRNLTEEDFHKRPSSLSWAKDRENCDRFNRDNDYELIDSSPSFPLPGYHRKNATSSSTESESSKKYHRKNILRKRSSLADDENYDGEDERTICPKDKESNSDHATIYRRESSDNISSLSDEKHSSDNRSDKILRGSLLLGSRNNYTILKTSSNEESDENNSEKSVNRFSSPKLNSKRRCAYCGKLKRLSKGKKLTSGIYCACDKRNLKNAIRTDNVGASELNTPGLSRSKVLDFNKKDEIPRENASTNVIVATTRKIFTPITQHGAGGTSVVVSYTLEESTEQPETINVPITEQNKMNYITPPCWILEQGRSQSVSPSSQRKESITLETPNERTNNNLANVSIKNSEKSPVNSPDVGKNNAGFLNVTNSKLPPTSPGSNRKNSLSKDNSESGINKIISRYNKLVGKQEGSSLNPGVVLKSRSSTAVAKCDRNTPNDISNSRGATFSKNDTNVVSHSATTTAVPSTFYKNRPSDKSLENIQKELRERNTRLHEARLKFFNDEISKNTEPLVSTSIEVPKIQTGTVKSARLNLHLDTNFEGSSVLNKSASTGTIDGGVSPILITPLPVSGEKISKSKFGFSSITSKFRKSRTKRQKDESTGAISSLCRASLFLNLQNSKSDRSCPSSTRSCPSSPNLRKMLAKRNSASN